MREARLSARLAHPNIVPVFDFGRSEDEYYLAMEWIDGVDLRALLDGSEPLEDYVVAYLVAEIARALAYAHETAPDAPIVHRDVKPANVLISRNGDVHLGDFGVATFDGQIGGVAGTPGYMAPEVGEGGADVRSDLYSLGKLLGELGGAGREPLAQIATQLTSRPAERPSAAEVAERLETHVAKIRGRGARSARSLLAERVTELADAREGAAVLDEGDPLEHTHSLLHAPEATASTAAPIEAEPAPRRRRYAQLGAAAGLALLAGAGWVWASPGDARPSAKPLLATKAPPTDQAPAAATTAAATTAAATRLTEPSEPSQPIPPEVVAAIEPRARVTRRVARNLHAAPPDRRRAAEAEDTTDEVAEPGRVSINAIPWARVSVDGVDRGSTPLLGLELSPGASHRVVLVNDVLDVRAERSVAVGPGETRRLIVDFRETAQGQASASAHTTPPP